LGIAQALINDPSVVFMDEPISALDPIGRRDVTEIIRALKQKGDTTVILSTHILADVEDVCDYVLIIEHGKIMAQDYLVNLKAKHRRNEATLRFYQTDAAEKFAAAVGSGGCGFTAEATGPIASTGPLQFTVRLNDQATPQNKNTPVDTAAIDTACEIAAAELSRAVNAVLHAHNLSIESYAAHSPSLEEIFLAVIKKTATQREVRHA